MRVSEFLQLATRAGAIADIGVAWLATYALHSTVLILIALVATDRRAPWQLATATRDVFWKTALVGSLVTASLQMAVDAAPLGGTWKLRRTPVTATTNVRVVVTSGREQLRASATQPILPALAPRVSPTSAFALPLPSIGQTVGGLPLAVFTGFSTSSIYVAVVALLWLAGVALMLWRYDRAGVQLDRLLRDRRPLEDGTVGSVLREAMRSAHVTRAIRLTVSDRLESPAVIDRDEICVPRRFLTDVNILEQETILAHELAHVVRRDVLWLRIANLVVLAFFFQPLNRLVRARLIEVAEFSADEWAARTTRAPLHLARALAAVVSWLSPAKRINALPAMACDRGSVLVRRVTRLTTWHDGEAVPCRRGAFALAVATLVGATVVAPRIDLTNPWSSLGVRHMVFQERIEKDGGRAATQVRVVDFDMSTDAAAGATKGRERVRHVILRGAADDPSQPGRGIAAPRSITVRRFTSAARSG